MANEITKTPIQYLNKAGLETFLNLLKEYIANRISEINGTNLRLNASGTNNPTITSQINDLWGAIGTTDGEGGTIVENIEKILSEYVKKIQEPTSQNLPLKIQITEGTGDNKGRFTIGLLDNGLNNTLSTLTTARVSKITSKDDGGAVTLSINKNTGEVEITVNSKELTERLETLESNRIKSVTKGTSTENYLTLDVSTAGLNTTISIDDSAIGEKFESIDGYTINSKKISESPTLTGDDITLGKSVGDNTNYPTSLDISDAIKKLRESISALGKVVELKGILTSLPSKTTGYEDGDMIIVGNKEYVCFNSTWYLLGDTTQLGEDLSSLISIYNLHKHSVTAKGKIENTFTGNAITHNHTFTGNQNTTSSNSLTISYSAGKLYITSAHTHTLTPTGTISDKSITPTGTVASTFIGEEVLTGEPDSKK